MFNFARLVLLTVSLRVARSFHVASPVASPSARAPSYARALVEAPRSLIRPPESSLTSVRSRYHRRFRPPPPSRDVPLASMSASSDDDDDSDGKFGLIESRTRRITAEYRVSSVLYLCTALYLATSGLFPPPGAAYAAAGPVMASATAYVLAGAAEHRRLGSDTYKRLNLFLAYYSVCGLASFAIRATGWGMFVPFALPYLVGLKPSLKGWRYGVKGVDKGGEASLFSDLVDGAKSSLKGIVSVGNFNAFGYLAATLFVAAIKVTKLVEIVNIIRSGEPSLVISGRIFRYAKLSLLTGIMYTLKDAADRGRLEGTTFVQLNFLSASVLGTLFAYLFFQAGEVTRVAGSAAFFSAFCAYNGAMSVMKKRQNS